MRNHLKEPHMRKHRTAVLLAAATLSFGLAGAAPAFAGAATPDPTSVNGGDHGWGNCGHNSSGGTAPSGLVTPGNGGYHKGDSCPGAVVITAS
jgi:hypothetical protein